MPEGSAFLFIEIDPRGHFHLTEKGKSLLSQYASKHISVIAITGPQRSGKSFLANAILKQMRGFNVGHTVQPCTKGIWVWGQPIEVDENSILIVLDCEGLYSTVRDNTFDAKLFTLSILISSVFVYNQLGHIDEKAIENMSLIINLGKSISLNQKNKKFQLQDFCPCFFWVLRDFSLDLKNQTPNDYLQSVLQPIAGNSIEIQNKNAIRQRMKQYFPSLECHCLCRPLEKEDELSNIEYQSYDSLRKPFKQSLSHLIKKLFQHLNPMEIHGKVIDVQTYGHLIENYCQKMNENGIPEIYSTLERVQAEQKIQFITKTEKILEEHFQKTIQKLPLESEELKFQWLQTIQNIKVPKNWEKEIQHQAKQELKMKGDKMLLSLEQFNKDKSMVHCSKLIYDFNHSTSLTPYEPKSENLKEYFSQIKGFMYHYNQNSKGPYKLKNIFNHVEGSLGTYMNSMEQHFSQQQQHLKQELSEQKLTIQRLKSQIQDYELYQQDLQKELQETQDELDSYRNDIEQHESEHIKVVNNHQNQSKQMQAQNDIIEALCHFKGILTEKDSNQCNKVLDSILSEFPPSDEIYQQALMYQLDLQQSLEIPLNSLQEALSLNLKEAFYIEAQMFEAQTNQKLQENSQNNQKPLQNQPLPNHQFQHTFDEEIEIPRQQPIETPQEQILKKYRISAEKGSIRGMCDTGFLLEKSDKKEAEKWYLKAIEGNSVRALNNLGLMWLNDGKINEGLSLIRKAARQGHPKAVYNLGQCYLEGWGVEQDTDKARLYFKSADKKGDLYGTLALITQDISQGKNVNYGDIFEKLMSLRGHHLGTEVEYHLGYLYDNGFGVQKDYKIAFQYYLEAAEQGCSKSLTRCGDFYNTGFCNVQADEKISIKFYKKAEQLGHIEAILNLGAIYENKQDYQQAIQHYENAAQKGSSWGHFNLGLIYKHMGQERSAYKAFLKAKEMGNKRAQEYLIQM